EAAGRDEEAAGAYAKAVARFEVKLTESEDDEEATDAAMRLRWARIQHAELLERLQRRRQAGGEVRHPDEGECAVAEANGGSEGEADSARGDRTSALGAPEPEPEDRGPIAETQDSDDEEDEESDELEAAGRLGLERLFARLVQLGRIDLAYLVLDDLGGELADERTRATYAIYDPGDGLPQIMVEHWDGQAREKLDPTKKT